MQIYKAERAGWPVRVYNLLYEDSQEADKFSAAVSREVGLSNAILLLLPPCPAVFALCVCKWQLKRL